LLNRDAAGEFVDVERLFHVYSAVTIEPILQFQLGETQRRGGPTAEDKRIEATIG